MAGAFDHRVGDTAVGGHNDPMNMAVDDHLAAAGGGDQIGHFGAVSKMDGVQPVKAGAQHVVMG